MATTTAAERLSSMTTTYTGILRDNRIEWTAAAPPELPADGVRVQVTLLDAVPAIGQGEQMAAALARLAAQDGLSSIGDAAAWQREVRKDRELPGRD
jgi:hypothetical protein